VGPGVDRPTPETAWICAVVGAILVSGVAVLWLEPDRTADLFAWTIRPDLTPLLMGSLYGAGAYLFVCAARIDRWHRVAVAFPPIAVFTALMLTATLLHWDRFNHGDAPAAAALSFWIWIVAYALAPFAMAAIWWRNRRADDGQPEAVDTTVPAVVRAVVAAGGAIALAVGCVAFLSPTSVTEHWPWALTPLTARVLGAFLVQSGAIALLLARDARWSAWRILVQTVVLGAVLFPIGLARAWSDLDGGNPLAWLSVAALAIVVAGGAALHVALDRRLAPPAAAAVPDAGR
jgi:hypothetical protein